MGSKISICIGRGDPHSGGSGIQLLAPSTTNDKLCPKGAIARLPEVEYVPKKNVVLGKETKITTQRSKRKECVITKIYIMF